MAKRITIDAIEETYKDVEPLINKLCWNHHKKVGGEFDDIKSQANLLFLLAYQTSNGKASFVTWLYTSIKYGLMSWTRADWRWYKNQKKIRDMLEKKIPIFYEPWLYVETNPLRVEAEFNESETIRTVLDTIFNTPKELTMKLNSLEDPIQIRKTIKTYLHCELGWSWQRINLAFKEVRRLIDVHQAFAVSE